MRAYLDDPNLKTAILAQLQAHHDADEIVQGVSWENGKGCAVGCTLHAYNHAAYETRFGIPEMLARLEDGIFEGLPNDQAKQWPIRFMGAIRPGADLSLVGWKLLYWLMTDKTVNPGIDHELVRNAVKTVAEGLALLSAGEPWSAELAARSAELAARSAEWSVAWSARSAAKSAAKSAELAAKSAELAAKSAELAAELAELAKSAELAELAELAVAWSARSAELAARSAEWSVAWSARSARSNSYIRMADKLIVLLQAA